jgi:hypothetical protein
MAGLLTPNNEIGGQVQKEMQDYINYLQFQYQNNTDADTRAVIQQELKNLGIEPMELPNAGQMMQPTQPAMQPQSQNMQNMTIAQLINMIKGVA